MFDPRNMPTSDKYPTSVEAYKTLGEAVGPVIDEHNRAEAERLSMSYIGMSPEERKTHELHSPTLEAGYDRVEKAYDHNIRTAQMELATIEEKLKDPDLTPQQRQTYEASRDLWLAMQGDSEAEQAAALGEFSDDVVAAARAKSAADLTDYFMPDGEGRATSDISQPPVMDPTTADTEANDPDSLADSVPNTEPESTAHEAKLNERDSDEASDVGETEDDKGQDDIVEKEEIQSIYEQARQVTDQLISIATNPYMDARQADKAKREYMEKLGNQVVDRLTELVGNKDPETGLIDYLAGRAEFQSRVDRILASMETESSQVADPNLHSSEEHSIEKDRIEPTEIDGEGKATLPSRFMRIIKAIDQKVQAPVNSWVSNYLVENRIPFHHEQSVRRKLIGLGYAALALTFSKPVADSALDMAISNPFRTGSLIVAAGSAVLTARSIKKDLEEKRIAGSGVVTAE